jgi:hypothetical protein
MTEIPVSPAETGISAFRRQSVMRIPNAPGAVVDVRSTLRGVE